MSEIFDIDVYLFSRLGQLPGERDSLGFMRIYF